MNQKIPDEGTRQDRWARFRFSVVGPLLSAPPKGGELRDSLISLSAMIIFSLLVFGIW